VFGHLGLSNIYGWADPERQIAGAVMTSGKPLLHPALWSFFTIPWQVGTALGKTDPRARLRSAKTKRARKPRAKSKTRSAAAAQSRRRRTAAGRR
jgi:hypothetical protein